MEKLRSILPARRTQRTSRESNSAQKPPTRIIKMHMATEIAIAIYGTLIFKFV
jgi:hypothetical protein